MGALCNRCPEYSRCSLNYLGKACKKTREKNCPDVVYTNEDKLLDSSHEELLRTLEKIAVYGRNTDLDQWLRTPIE